MDTFPFLEKVLYTEEEMKQRISELGKEITKDYQDKDLVVVSLLRGGAIFSSDLIREIKLPLEIDYMAVSSYGNGVKSSGVVRVLKDLNTEVEGRHVLIAEDVLDSGLTLRYIIDYLASRNPASIEVVACLRKDVPGQVDVDCKYVGFNCANEFIVGYGLDYAEKYRNLPCIGVLKPEIYQAQ